MPSVAEPTWACFARNMLTRRVRVVRACHPPSPGRLSRRQVLLQEAAQVAAGQSCIVEANFSYRYATPAFQRVATRHPFRSLQINCVADPEVLRARSWTRSRSGERHPGHQDHLPPDSLDVPNPGRLPPLDIGGQVIELDTSDWDRLDYSALLDQIQSSL